MSLRLIKKILEFLRGLKWEMGKETPFSPHVTFECVVWSICMFECVKNGEIPSFWKEKQGISLFGLVSFQGEWVLGVEFP